ncbi:MAG TPA: hypothetical protein DCS07_17995 [Bdellovibrionales bacterium]|nr:hypothetical protein [Bdellovibrionales bacterium]HCM38570.1 hypothetical protein [Bdellovibrionales bacterium]
MGPQINHLNTSLQPDNSAQFIDSSLILGYKLNPDVTISAAYNFSLYLLREKDMTYNNPALRITHTKLYDNGQGVSLAGAFRAYLPLTESSRENNLITQLRGDETLNYDLQGTRWSLGMDFLQRVYLYSSDVALGKPGLKSLVMSFDPYCSYQINDKLSARFVSSKGMNKAFANQATFNTSANMDGTLSVNWQAHSKVHVSPMINFQPTNMSLNATQAYLEVVVRIL